MPRKNEGTLIHKPSGWYARFWVTIDGVKMRKWFDLETRNRNVAQEKRARIADELSVARSMRPGGSAHQGMVDARAFAARADRYAHEYRDWLERRAFLVEAGLTELRGMRDQMRELIMRVDTLEACRTKPTRS